MKYLIRETCKVKLVLLSYHQRNMAEIAIKAFKQHFLSELDGVLLIVEKKASNRWASLLFKVESLG